MINVILTPSGLWRTAYLSVWMGRRHAGLDVFADEYCFEERKLPCLSHVSRLGSYLGFSACCLSFVILLYLELYLVEITYVVGFILC